MENEKRRFIAKVDQIEIELVEITLEKYDSILKASNFKKNGDVCGIPVYFCQGYYKFEDSLFLCCSFNHNYLFFYPYPNKDVTLIEFNSNKKIGERRFYKNKRGFSITDFKKA